MFSSLYGHHLPWAVCLEAQANPPRGELSYPAIVNQGNGVDVRDVDCCHLFSFLFFLPLFFLSSPHSISFFFLSLTSSRHELHPNRSAQEYIIVDATSKALNRSYFQLSRLLGPGTNHVGPCYGRRTWHISKPAAETRVVRPPSALAAFSDKPVSSPPPEVTIRTAQCIGWTAELLSILVGWTRSFEDGI